MIHYLILAHKNPEQLQLLCDALCGSESRIYIHLDGNVDISDYIFLEKNKIVYIQDRVRINWGGFTMVQATLNSLVEILPYMAGDDHLVVMSGQDFPIKSQAYIYDFLATAKGKSYLGYMALPNDEWDITSRVTKYYFHDLIVPDWIDTLCKKIVGIFITIPPLRNQLFGYIWQRVVNFFLPRRKYLLQHYTLYWGSQWQILSSEAVSYITTFCASSIGNKFIQAFMHTAGPDEFFFQTILMNSSLKDTINNHNPWYMDWKTGDTLPKILNTDDIANIMQSTDLFARKFDITMDKSIVEYLSGYIMHE